MGFFTGFDWRAISVYASGIKCDSCSHSEPLVTRFEYDKYLNRPCPICGEKLLTSEDYRKVKISEKVTTVFNIVLAPAFFLQYIFSSEYRKKMREGKLYVKTKYSFSTNTFEKVEDDE